MFKSLTGSVFGQLRTSIRATEFSGGTNGRWEVTILKSYLLLSEEGARSTKR